VLIYCVWRFSKKDASKAQFTHGSHKLEMLWTAIPAGLLLIIALFQMETWANIRFAKNFPDGEPIAIAWASQFDWRFQYPGADGVLGTMDDFESAHDFVVPLGEPVKFILRSRDVIHSFSVPQFRLKQDAMPGMAIPVWFEVEPGEDENKDGVPDNVGDYELICMELCGWGHYKMAGVVRALPRAEYDAWVLEQQANFMSNGIEE
jgi:cytochrome c oxidase subunit 2